MRSALRVGAATVVLVLGGCSSIDSSTSKALDACAEITDEAIRADCIVGVAETDPDR